MVHRLTAKTNTVIYKVNRRELYCAVELPLSDYKLYGKQLAARWFFTACKGCHSVPIDTLWQPFCLLPIGRQFGVNVFAVVVKIYNTYSERHIVLHKLISFLIKSYNLYHFECLNLIYDSIGHFVMLQSNLLYQYQFVLLLCE